MHRHHPQLSPADPRYADARFGLIPLRRWYYFGARMSLDERSRAPFQCAAYRYLGYSVSEKSPGAMALYDWYAQLKANSCDRVLRQLWDPSVGKYLAAASVRSPSLEQIQADCLRSC